MTKLSDFEMDNFMEMCFNNKENIYSEGPGAGLEENKNLMLCLKNIPKNMDNQALKNILSNYGEVLSVTKMNDIYNPLRFAVCKDATSLEAILRGMSTNEWGIQVSQKTEKKIDAFKEPVEDYEIDSSKEISKDSSTLVIEDLLRPSLTTLKYPEYSNQSEETSYFLNRRIIDYVYNIGSYSTYDISFNSRYEFTNLHSNNYCKESKSIKNIETGYCFVCGNCAVYNCERCEEFYCSKACQEADWPTHKFACTEKPRLIKLKNLKIRDPYKNLRVQKGAENKIRSGIKVVITHIEKSNCVFVRSVEKNDYNDYVKIINIIASFGVTAKKVSKLLAPGDFVLSQYNNEWFRAIVLNFANENEILIAYPDLGCTILKLKSELRDFPTSLENLKQFVCCVCLKDVPDVVLNKNAKEFLYGLVNENVMLKIQYEDAKSNNLFSVDLKAVNTNQNINKRLNILINPIKPSIYETPIFLKDITMIKFKPCRNTRVIVLDNSFIESGLISCILNNDAEELDKINAQITNFSKSVNDFYTPRESEICLVKASNAIDTWYRACCEVVSGDGKPILTLLDYGNICQVSINNIRKCPKQLNLPCFTNECHIKGLQTVAKNGQINDSAKKKLQDVIKLHEMLIVSSIEIINGKIFITLPEELVRYIKDYKIVEFDED